MFPLYHMHSDGAGSDIQLHNSVLPVAKRLSTCFLLFDEAENVHNLKIFQMKCCDV